jgi:pentose-5-phosphate-3-epimerase
MDTPRGSDDLVAAALLNADIFSAAGAFGVAKFDAKQRGALSQILLGKRSHLLRLARWEHTPEVVLQLIAEQASHDQLIQTRLMRNQNAPILGNALEQAAGLNRSLLSLLAQHKQAPKALLMQLATEDLDLTLLKSLARNPASDAEVLAVLLAREPSKLASEILANPSASSETLKTLYQQGDAYIKSAVLGHEGLQMSDDLLSQALVDAGLREDEAALRTGQDLSLKPDLSLIKAQCLLQRQIAKFNLTITPTNTFAPSEFAPRELGISESAMSELAISELLASEDVAVRAALASNPSFVDVHLMIADPAPAVRRALAARADLSIHQMQTLSWDADVWVRVKLARNPALNTNTMLHLAQDQAQEVRRGVARNTHCPLSLLENFALDDAAWVRAAVAYQANANAHLLVQLASDADVDVLSGVASNQHTPKAILQQLALHSDADVRRGVILNPAADRETLLPMLQDAYYLHRMLLVWNKQLNADDKWSLHDDPDENVRFAVFKFFADRLSKDSEAVQ